MTISLEVGFGFGDEDESDWISQGYELINSVEFLVFDVNSRICIASVASDLISFQIQGSSAVNIVSDTHSADVDSKIGAALTLALVSDVANQDASAVLLNEEIYNSLLYNGGAPIEKEDAEEVACVEHDEFIDIMKVFARRT